jgi:nucleoid-associated protein YgaU
MSSRFQEPLEQEQTGDSPRHYKTALVINKPDTTLSVTHVVKFGDRFDNLAYKYYGTPTLWWYIALANSFVDGSMIAPVGTSLVIPKLNL